MEQTEIINILLAILAFIGALSVKQLMSIAKSVGEIKTEFKVLATKHDDLERRVKNLEE